MLDKERPTIVCPSTLTTCTDVIVTDNADPSPTVRCLPFGTSRLKLVRAKDASGNVAVRLCMVTVRGMTHNNRVPKLLLPHISVEHDEKPPHTKFDMNRFLVAQDMAT